MITLSLSQADKKALSLGALYYYDTFVFYQFKWSITTRSYVKDNKLIDENYTELCHYNIDLKVFQQLKRSCHPSFVNYNPQKIRHIGSYSTPLIKIK
jgi:hypothetical protein